MIPAPTRVEKATSADSRSKNCCTFRIPNGSRGPRILILLVCFAGIFFAARHDRTLSPLHLRIAHGAHPASARARRSDRLPGRSAAVLRYLDRAHVCYV